MATTNHQTAADVFDGWGDDVLTGTPPTFYSVGTGELARIEIGPKLVTLIGGAPARRRLRCNNASLMHFG